MKRITPVAIAAATVLMLVLVACGAPAATPTSTPAPTITPRPLTPTASPAATPTRTSASPTPTTAPAVVLRAGTFLAKWGSQGSGDGQFNFNGAGDLAVDASGNVYVADTGNYRIQKFTSGGAFLAEWGTVGSGDGQFGRFPETGQFYNSSPNGVAVNASGNVTVADVYNNRIQTFTSGGAFEAKWETPRAYNNQVSPNGVAVDAAGNVYATGGDQIQKYTPAGTLLAQWRIHGSDDVQVSEGIYRVYIATAIAVDTEGNIYVAEGYRIQKYNSGGAFVAKWGTVGSADGQFRNPNGVAVDASGNVYVADTGNNRIQVFASGKVP